MRGLSDGDPVSSWSDLSGHGNNATQSGSGKPLYVANGLNGNAVLHFNGAGDYLLASAVSVSQPDTIFVVGRSSVTPYNYEFFFDGSTSRQAFLYSSSSVGVFAGSLAFAGTSDTGWHSFAVNFNGASSEIYDNGLLLTTANAGTNSLGGLVIGYDLGDGGFGLNGDIAQIIVFGQTVPAAMRQRIGQSGAFSFRISTR